MNKTLLQRMSDKAHSLREAPQWLASKLGLGEQIHFIRQTLGMTQAQLGKRAGMRQNAIAHIETKKGDMQVSTLEKLAAALECELIVRLVPKRDLVELLEEKSEKLARRLVQISTANSAMELQKPEAKYIEIQIKEKQDEILKKQRSLLWESDEDGTSEPQVTG